MLCISISVLLFYRRVFPVQQFRRIVDTLIGVHVAWTIALTVVHLCSCTPITMLWTNVKFLLANRAKMCLNYPLAFVALLSIELVLNVAVLFLPVRQIMKLKLDLGSRFMLSFIFLLGGV